MVLADKTQNTNTNTLIFLGNYQEATVPNPYIGHREKFPIRNVVMCERRPVPLSNNANHKRTCGIIKNTRKHATRSSTGPYTVKAPNAIDAKEGPLRKPP